MSGDEGISRRDLLRGRFWPAAAPGGGSGPDPDSIPGRETGPAIGPGLVHRPPGAVAEADFLAGCTRCGDCITACPVDAITLAGDRYGRAVGTPIIEPMSVPCIMCEDTPCIAACEPGVLTLDAPLAMGTASIRQSYCLAHEGTTCTVCSERCPVDDAIEVDRRGRPTVVAGTCTGCGVCQHVCPAPYNAVLILPRGAATEEPPAETGGFDWRAAYFRGRSLRPPIW